MSGSEGIRVSVLVPNGGDRVAGVVWIRSQGVEVSVLVPNGGDRVAEVVWM